MSFRFSLRPFQKRWARKTWESLTERIEGQRFTRILATAATGCGKTVMSAALIYAANRQKMRVLFLCNSEELVYQAQETIFNAAGIISDVEKAEKHASRSADLVIGSIQTMSQSDRLKTWNKNHWDLIIYDEAHTSMCDSAQRVLKYFNQDGAGARILGITATPERGDDRNLWDFYEHLADEISLFELIDAGYLAPLTVQTVPIEIDATGATVRANYADDGNDMEEAIEPYWDAIIDAFKDIAGDRQTLFFHPGIRASRRFTDRLQQAGIPARHVDGKSPDRREILAGFARGDFQALNNAQLLTTGYDCPRIQCVCVLRPTKSRVAYQQMIGRGTRLKPEGSAHNDCLLLDFLWQFEERMRPQGPADLVTRDKDTRDAVAAKLESGEALDLIDAKTELERERESAFIQRLKQLAKNRRAMRFDARELGALLHQPDLCEYTATANWQTEKPTDRQKEVLKKFGVKVGNLRTRGEASAILSCLFDRKEKGLASPKQVAALAIHGIDGGHEIAFEDASRELSIAFANSPRP